MKYKLLNKFKFNKYHIKSIPAYEYEYGYWPGMPNMIDKPYPYKATIDVNYFIVQPWSVGNWGSLLDPFRDKPYRWVAYISNEIGKQIAPDAIRLGDRYLLFEEFMMKWGFEEKIEGKHYKLENKCYPYR